MADEPMFVSVDVAARRIGIGRSLAYELCRAYLQGRPDGLPCTRLGRRVLVPAWAIEELGPARDTRPGDAA